MKKKLITHTDLDGVGNAILAKHIYEEEVDICYCDYGDVNDTINKFIDNKEYAEYDTLYITDISVNEETAEKLNELPIKVVLLDHHPTALWLHDKYDWATVVIDVTGLGKACGTWLFYHYLMEFHKERKKEIEKKFSDFVEIVRRYDTFEWKNFDSLIPKQLNDLFYLLGKEKFIEKYTKHFVKYNKIWFDDADKILLDIRQEEIDKYVKKKDYELVIKEITVNGKKYNAGIIFSDRFGSEVGNELCAKHIDTMDFIIMVSFPNSLSFRSCKDNIDLGKDVAAFFGGGGHPRAAGAPMTEELKNKILNLII